MSGFETVEAPCPNCSTPMYQKHETMGAGLIFDACAKCGYVAATLNDEDLSSQEAWASILENRGEGAKTIRDFYENTGWFKGNVEQKSKILNGEPIFIPENIQERIFDINYVFNF